MHHTILHWNVPHQEVLYPKATEIPRHDQRGKWRLCFNQKQEMRRRESAGTKSNKIVRAHDGTFLENFDDSEVATTAAGRPGSSNTLRFLEGGIHGALSLSTFPIRFALAVSQEYQLARCIEPKSFRLCRMTSYLVTKHTRTHIHISSSLIPVGKMWKILLLFRILFRSLLHEFHQFGPFVTKFVYGTIH